ncbi:MAG: hypothetical protein NC310_05695 [Roseburia sp.]|nr:hypothetical protein [Anaeroplasma bactoclasticum]MCM1196542.1 hypothetical protein [Roseburia sp.]MCM1557634.1 hypothetical protein [Anaeroplasma bactoclasticum]
MKILEIILEAVLSPFSSLMRISGIGKNFLSAVAKPVFILLIAVVITTILILYFYRDFIFR